MPALVSIALFLHVAGVVVWVGGMAFAQFALRPAAIEILEPPLRLPLLAGALGRFFSIATVAIIVVIAAGLVLVASLGGVDHVGRDIRAMAGMGLTMAGIYVYVRIRPFPELRAAVAARKWPDAAAALARVRTLLMVNLGLGMLTIAVATLGR